MCISYQNILLSGLLIAILGAGKDAYCQTDHAWNVADGNYNTNGNWDVGFRPDGEFDERAIINNGGTARVSNNVLQPAQVRLGIGSSSGTLVVENGGTLQVYNGEFAPDNLSSGGIDVGEGGGTGTVRVEPGGTLNAGYFIVNGTNSSVFLDGSGASPTNVFIENIVGKASGTNVHNGQSFRVKGSNLNYSSANFDLEPGSTFISEITSSSHSTIQAPGGVFPDGTFRLEFNGYSPSFGDTWDLFDTTSISTTDVNIESSGANLPAGQHFTFRSFTDPGSTHGVTGQIGIEQRLALSVDRDSGAMTIMTGTETVSFDGYTIRSALGGINPTNWNSLEEQNLPAWKEAPAGGIGNEAIAELKSSGSTAVTSGTPLGLGNVFQLPSATQFQTELEDIQFEYFLEDGTIVQGDVIYEGDKQYNDLVLVVDPDDGRAMLQNQSNLSVSIDGYNISSVSGSLLPNNGDWLSLDDQGTNSGSWTEANGTTNDLSELRSSGSTLLTGGLKFDLGMPVQTVSGGGQQDLTFSYLLPGDSQFTEGVVVYRDIQSVLFGDADNDGAVAGSDLLAVTNNFGSTGVANGLLLGDADDDGAVAGSDLLAVTNNFGSTLGSLESGGLESGANVPEPATAVALLLGASLATIAMRRRA